MVPTTQVGRNRRSRLWDMGGCLRMTTPPLSCCSCDRLAVDHSAITWPGSGPWAVLDVFTCITVTNHTVHRRICTSRRSFTRVKARRGKSFTISGATTSCYGRLKLSRPTDRGMSHLSRKFHHGVSKSALFPRNSGGFPLLMLGRSKGRAPSPSNFPVRLSLGVVKRPPSINSAHACSTPSPPQ
ncbi:hypothetical protein BDW67DRAFT_46409 [Aspergillus spinulosporus]